MGWDIKDDGFVLVRQCRVTVADERGAGAGAARFLDRSGFWLSDFNGFLFHPGGRKLIETMQEVLGLPTSSLRSR